MLVSCVEKQGMSALLIPIILNPGLITQILDMTLQTVGRYADHATEKPRHGEKSLKNDLSVIIERWEKLTGKKAVLIV